MGDEQSTESTRFRRLLRGPCFGTFRELATKLRRVNLLDPSISLGRLAKKLDNIINDRNSYIYMTAPPRLDTRMEDTADVLRDAHTLAQRHQDNAMVIMGYSILGM